MLSIFESSDYFKNILRGTFFGSALGTIYGGITDSPLLYSSGSGALTGATLGYIITKLKDLKKKQKNKNDDNYSPPVQGEI